MGSSSSTLGGLEEYTALKKRLDERLAELESSELFVLLRKVHDKEAPGDVLNTYSAHLYPILTKTTKMDPCEIAYFITVLLPTFSHKRTQGGAINMSAEYIDVQLRVRATAALRIYEKLLEVKDKLTVSVKGIEDVFGKPGGSRRKTNRMKRKNK